jgi:hypothetical protein
VYFNYYVCRQQMKRLKRYVCECMNIYIYVYKTCQCDASSYWGTRRQEIRIKFYGHPSSSRPNHHVAYSGLRIYRLVSTFRSWTCAFLCLAPLPVPESPNKLVVGFHALLNWNPFSLLILIYCCFNKSAHIA